MSATCTAHHVKHTQSFKFQHIILVAILESVISFFRSSAAETVKQGTLALAKQRVYTRIAMRDICFSRRFYDHHLLGCDAM
jgi:hypothetical protein